MFFRSSFGPLCFAFVTFGWASLCFTQTSQPTALNPQLAATTSDGKQLPEPQSNGTITGTVVDQSGAVVAGARVILTRENSSPNQNGSSDNGSSNDDQSARNDALTDGNGQFSFSNVAPGTFHLTISSAGLDTQTYAGVLRAGETETVPQLVLAVAPTITEVEVELTRPEVAEEQIKAEEKQRVLGIVPNFYVSYIPNAVPLTSKQKFKLAARTVVDPVTFLIVAASAGVEQAQNHFIEYGQGMQGYAKRFGANYADTVSGTFIGGAILPSLLKQDPRYFYKGTGSAESRAAYAIAASVICRGDNGRWQPNYSNILGSLAAGGISNLYYPSNDRNGVGLTFTNAAIGIAANAVTNLMQEFVIKKLTPKASNHDPAKP